MTGAPSYRDEHAAVAASLAEARALRERDAASRWSIIVSVGVLAVAATVFGSL